MKVQHYPLFMSYADPKKVRGRPLLPLTRLPQGGVPEYLGVSKVLMPPT